MGDFFNLDNKFFQGLSKVVDCVILSVLWVFCCIPMATTFFLAWQSASVFGWILCWLTSFLAGPATTALYYAVNKVIRHGRSYLWKEYWHAFKSNFKQAALAALILTGVVLFLGLDCYIMYQFAAQGQKSGVLYVVFLVLIVLVVMLAVYLFAYMARFENSLGQSFKNAALIAVANLPWSLLLLVLLVASAFGLWMLPWLMILLPAVYILVANFTRIVSVVMSRSLVGSSRNSTFGALMSTRSKYSRRFSPPDSLPIVLYCRFLSNRNCSSICAAVRVPCAVSI